MQTTEIKVTNSVFSATVAFISVQHDPGPQTSSTKFLKKSIQLPGVMLPPDAAFPIGAQGLHNIALLDFCFFHFCTYAASPGWSFFYKQ